MPFANNTTLITTADTLVIAADGVDGTIEDTSARATAFIVQAGATGHDKIVGFGQNDSLLMDHKLYDSNNDGIVSFGENSVLDLDRTSKSAGSDRLEFAAFDSKALRFLGNKDGHWVYADASVRLAGFTEGTVGNDTFDGAGGNKTFFFDNALGLNLGGDTIKNFTAGDFIVTTSKIFDATKDAEVTFGKNGVLDLSGEGGAADTDPTKHPGGQIDVVGASSVFFDHQETIHGVTYYYYGAVAP
ncbi:hypothetical protein BH10PSE15_BH10PSE15_03550 [soil metagenome]